MRGDRLTGSSRRGGGGIFDPVVGVHHAQQSARAEAADQARHGGVEALERIIRPKGPRYVGLLDAMRFALQHRECEHEVERAFDGARPDDQRSRIIGNGPGRDPAGIAD